MQPAACVLRNATYRASVWAGEGVEISDLTASRDLRALVGAGLLVAVGETRGRHYIAGDELRQRLSSIRASRPRREDEDPCADPVEGSPGSDQMELL